MGVLELHDAATSPGAVIAGAGVPIYGGDLVTAAREGRAEEQPRRAGPHDERLHECLRYTNDEFITSTVDPKRESVKMPQERRPYRSALREEQARSTRRAIVGAARDLFVDLGWSRTTIDAVAARAGVSRKTVFTSVGGKTALLKLALDWALVGDDEPVPMADRPIIAEMERLTDPHALVARWARFVAELEERAAPLAAVLAVAADADPEAAGVHATSERNRLGGAAAFVEHLAALDALRPGLTTERAVAAALVLMDPAAYRTLVHEHRWTRHEYAGWIERAAVAELLGEPPTLREEARPRR
jgi:AcrR family transcriptional regulator